MQQTLPPAPLQGAATWRIGGHDDRAISHLFWEIHRQPKPTHCQHNTVATNGTNYTKKTSRINITKIRLTNIQTNTSSISKITLHMIYELSLNQKFCLQFATQMGHSCSLGTRQSTMSLFWNSNDQTHTNIHWFIHCHITNIPVNCSDWISTTS